MARIVLSPDSQPVPNMTTCALVMFTNTQQMHLVQYLTDFRNAIYIYIYIYMYMITPPQFSKLSTFSESTLLVDFYWSLQLGDIIARAKQMVLEGLLRLRGVSDDRDDKFVNIQVGRLQGRLRESAVWTSIHGDAMEWRGSVLQWHWHSHAIAIPHSGTCIRQS